MTGPAQPPPAGQCVCGLPLPDDCPSDWACSEVCQAAWTHHQADPDYPHPRDIRAAMAAAAKAARTAAQLPPLLGCAAPVQIPDGTEVETDDGAYVRVGAHWQPAGMWTPIPRQHVLEQLDPGVQYRRWCATCQTRQPSFCEFTFTVTPTRSTQVQVCDVCGHRWPGLPLLGMIEVRGDPWPAIRLRLTDTIRSAVTVFPEQEVQRAGPGIAVRLCRTWLRLERQLGSGWSDADQPTPAQQARAARRRRGWDAPVDLGRVNL